MVFILCLLVRLGLGDFLRPDEKTDRHTSGHTRTHRGRQGTHRERDAERRRVKGGEDKITTRPDRNTSLSESFSSSGGWGGRLTPFRTFQDISRPVGRSVGIAHSSFDHFRGIFLPPFDSLCSSFLSLSDGKLHHRSVSQ